MIHQYIFAGPKPGLSARAFQSYWINFHAVDYAAKIPQIRQYLVAERLDVPIRHPVAFFEGVAEIWLADERDQIASMQSREFLEGARADEPRWAAFWQTFVLDTDSEILKAFTGVPPLPEYVKSYSLLKRRQDMSLKQFRQGLLAAHSKLALTLPELQQYEIGFARESLYGFGEPRFDAIETWSFSGSQHLQDALKNAVALKLEESWRSLADGRYLFTFVGQEHWIVRPGERE